MSRDKPIIYKTQDGQPYGSESRKCSECGTMLWGANQPAHTGDHEQLAQSSARLRKLPSYGRSKMTQTQELLDAAVKGLRKANLVHSADGLTSKARAFGPLSQQVKEFAKDGISGLKRVNQGIASLKDMKDQHSSNADAIAALNQLIEAIDAHQLIEAIDDHQ